MSRYEPRFMISRLGFNGGGSGGAVPLRPEDVLEEVQQWIDHAGWDDRFDIRRLTEREVQGWAEQGVANCQFQRDL